MGEAPEYIGAISSAPKKLEHCIHNLCLFKLAKKEKDLGKCLLTCTMLKHSPDSNGSQKLFYCRGRTSKNRTVCEVTKGTKI